MNSGRQVGLKKIARTWQENWGKHGNGLAKRTSIAFRNESRENWYVGRTRNFYWIVTSENTAIPVLTHNRKFMRDYGSAGSEVTTEILNELLPNEGPILFGFRGRTQPIASENAE